MADTHYYIDTTLGAGADDGTAHGDAWQGMADALKGMQYNAFNAATRNLVWIRRTSSHTMGADINLSDDGAADKPILFIGWPRPAIPNTTITEGEFTNGSNIVDNVVGITIDRESHLGRFITAPDGEQYLITAILWEATVDGMAGGAEFTVGSKLTNVTQTKYGKIWAFIDNLDTTGTLQFVVDSSSAWVDDDNITDADGGDAELDVNASAIGFLIDREYAGSTVTSTDGKFQIEADEWYADRPAAAKAAWDGDAIDLPQIDGNSANFSLQSNNDEWYGFEGIDFKNGADVTYGMAFMASQGNYFKGCLFYVDAAINECVIYNNVYELLIDRCIFEGGGAAQVSQYFILNYGTVTIEDSALYGGGSYAISTPSSIVNLKNTNVGIEQSNINSEFLISASGTVKGVDVKLGGDNGYLTFSKAVGQNGMHIENYQKVLGDHKSIFPGGEYISTAVSGEAPNKKLSDIVLKITPNIAGYEAIEQGWHFKIPLGEINADAGSQTFKFWLYNDTGVTLNDGNAIADIYLQAGYISSYDDASEYTMPTATSAEHTIADAADADDWDSLSVTINPAVESKVRLYLRISIYETDDIFIDPQVVIT